MKSLTKKILLSSLATAALISSGNSKADRTASLMRNSAIMVETEAYHASVANRQEPADGETKKQQLAGWYMRTGISAVAGDGTVYNHNSAGIFGKLKQSQSGKDRHDIMSFGTAVLQVVFPQTDWDEDNGDYFSDYRHFNPTASGEKSAWTFQVNNQRDVDLTNASLTITLDGSYRVTYTKTAGHTSYTEAKNPNSEQKNLFTLIDVDNHQAYNYKELQSAPLNMDGLHTRTFRWVLGDVGAEDYEALASTPASRIAPFSRSAKFSTMKKPLSKFGFPPQ